MASEPCRMTTDALTVDEQLQCLSDEVAKFDHMINDLEEKLELAKASGNTKEVERIEGLINRNMKMFNKAFNLFIEGTE